MLFPLADLQFVCRADVSLDAISETDHNEEAKNHLRKLYSAFLVSVKRVFVYHGVPQLVIHSMSGEVG
jgi:hypothetical protein